MPVLNWGLTQQAAYLGARPDADQEFVLGVGEHGAASRFLR
jgi:hypothetical protein